MTDWVQALSCMDAVMFSEVLRNCTPLLCLIWLASLTQDFTFVCPTEITAFSDRYDGFKELDCEVHLAVNSADLWGATVNPELCCTYWICRTNTALAACAGPGCLGGLAVLAPGLDPDRSASLLYIYHVAPAVAASDCH